jgi:hypothetical protein
MMLSLQAELRRVPEKLSAFSFDQASDLSGIDWSSEIMQDLTQGVYYRMLVQTFDYAKELRVNLDKLIASQLKSYFIWLIVSEMACLLIVLGATFWILRMIQLDLLSIISTFGYLSEKDLGEESKRLTGVRTFLESDIFKDSLKVEEAYFLIKGRIDANNTDSQNIQPPPMKGKTNEHGTVQRSVMRSTRVRTEDAKSKGLFSSVMVGSMSSLLALVLVAGTIVMKFFIYQIESNIGSIKTFIMTHGEQILLLTLKVESLYHLSPIFNNTALLSSLGGDYGQYWRDWRDTLPGILEEDATAILSILSEDLCQAKEFMSLRDGLCEVLGLGVARQGSLAVDSYIQRNYLSSTLELASSNQDARWSIWYSSPSVQSRLLATLFYPILLQSIPSRVEGNINSRADRSGRIISSLRITGLVILLGPLLLAYRALRLFIRDYTVSYRVFRILSPATILKNQYVLSRFKRLYKVDPK